MTNSMIPYSFIPGTKAKAGEVNANFIALAELIAANADALETKSEELNSVISGINSALDTKSDKTSCETEFQIGATTTNLNLNNYTKRGAYSFSASYVPTNGPKSTPGMLIVRGAETQEIKQIWLDRDSYEIFTRVRTGGNWRDWKSVYGDYAVKKNGYLKLSNGMMFQWGYQASQSVTYPVAFKTASIVLFSKSGYDAKYERSDTGLLNQALTGFSIGTGGVFTSLNWIAIGY